MTDDLFTSTKNAAQYSSEISDYINACVHAFAKNAPNQDVFLRSIVCIGKLFDMDCLPSKSAFDLFDELRTDNKKQRKTTSSRKMKSYHSFRAFIKPSFEQYPSITNKNIKQYESRVWKSVPAAAQKNWEETFDRLSAENEAKWKEYTSNLIQIILNETLSDSE